MPRDLVKLPRTIRAVRSFGFAGKGVAHLVRTQPNARVHLAATLGVLGLAVWTGATRVEWFALVAAIGLVWTAEALNTAVEVVIDLVSPEAHPLAKVAKDVAAGAVLLAALTALVIAALVFIPAVLG
jgi:diacylglycerol kinase (ATP)